ncbi:oligosaccharide flippase family protein [Haladaptatus salinisoli]|uniref:oligosaccharide flippase family protein n=1 Tax=Haladaptatus salinisoli TaxID=2884876 RepID=UPI001D0B258D|nr:lipopolysaccharide biosynthesis protein [Haladaptatus salinisoli]
MSNAANISLGRETLSGTVAKIVMALAGFVGSIVFARVLGPTMFGGVYLLLGLVRIVDRPMSGWAAAGKKRLSESDNLRNEALGANLLFNTLWIIVVTIGILLFAKSLREYTGLLAAPLLLILLLSSESVFITLERLVQARGRISTAVWLDTVRSYLTLGLQLLLVIAGLGAVGMIVGLAGASLATLPIVVFYLSARPRTPSKELLRRYWRFAKYSIPSDALGTIYDRLDILLLGAVLTPTVAGYYEAAFKLTIPAIFIAEVAGSGLMAKTSAISARGGNIHLDIENTISFTSLIAIPICFGTLVFADEIIVTAYGGAFAAAAPLLIALAIYRVIRTQSGPLLQAVNGLDRPDISMRLSAIAVVVNIVGGIGLILWIGPVGVVVSTIAAESIRYVGAALLLKQELTTINLIPHSLLEQVGAGLAMFIIVTSIQSFIQINSWVYLALIIGLGGFTYFLFLFAVSSKFRMTLQSAVPSVKIV